MSATAAAAAVTSGLFAREQPVPLLGVSVEVEIRHYGARVVLSQRYRNDETKPIEAVYKFPLDEAAAVVGFEALIDGRRVVGRVEEKEKAFAAYDEAMAAGHGAYLLDEERADLFTLSVGNVPPGKEVVLRITTVSELALEGEAIRFTLPTTVSPRYAPLQDQLGVGITERERVTPPFALAVPYGLTLKIDVEASAAIRRIASPSHPIDFTVEGSRASGGLAQRETAMDRDFVLQIELAEAHQPCALVERGPDGADYALVSFRPRLETKVVASEIVFLVDRSGSMQGPSIREVREALLSCLKSLPADCRLNIVGFGSAYKALFPESRPCDAATLEAAAAYVRSIEADMGGTEILEPLRFALEAKALEGMPRQLFVVTDGQVSNVDAVVELVRRHGGTTRVFTFGMGASPSRELVLALARAGEGDAEFIAPGERVEAKVLRQLGRALSPALTDVRVDWNGLEVEQAPHVAPPVFDGGRVLVFGRLASAKAATVQLRARSRAGEVSFALPVEPSGREGTLVASLWARRAIRDLEEGASPLHARRGSQQARGAVALEERVKARIVELGTRHGLVSRHTSFVAIEERETPVEGEAVLRKVPVAISKGWHGIGEPLACGAPMMARCLDAAAPMASRESGPMRSGMRRFFSRLSVQPDAEAESVADARRRWKWSRVLQLQSPEGYWELTDKLAAVIEIDRRELDAAVQRVLSELRELVAEHTGSREHADALASQVPAALVSRALATVLAMRWLERECADRSREWSEAMSKADRWLDAVPLGKRFWFEVVQRFLPAR